jgi:translation initiation factor IF-2
VLFKKRLQKARVPVLVVINKMDLLSEVKTAIIRNTSVPYFNHSVPRLILPDLVVTQGRVNASITIQSIQQKWQRLLPNANILPVTAAYGLGIRNVLKTIVSYLKPVSETMFFGLLSIIILCTDLCKTMLLGTEILS